MELSKEFFFYSLKSNTFICLFIYILILILDWFSSVYDTPFQEIQVSCDFRDIPLNYNLKYLFCYFIMFFFLKNLNYMFLDLLCPFFCLVSFFLFFTFFPFSFSRHYCVFISGVTCAFCNLICISEIILSFPFISFLNSVNSQFHVPTVCHLFSEFLYFYSIFMTVNIYSFSI